MSLDSFGSPCGPFADSSFSQFLADTVSEGVLVVDSTGQIRYANPAIEPLLGYAPSSLVGQPMAILIPRRFANQHHPFDSLVSGVEDAPWSRCEVSVAGATGKEKQLRCRLGEQRHEGKRLFTLVLSEAPGPSADEETLRQYKRAIMGATDLICATDPTDQYLFANPQYCTYHGIETKDVTTLTIDDVFEPPERQTIKRKTRRALAGENVSYRMTRTHPTKGERIFDVHYYPLDGRDGEVTGVVAVLRDITDREERTRHLQVVDRMLRHNLRNELTKIRLQAEQLADEGGRAGDVASEIIDNVDGFLATCEKTRNVTRILGTRLRSTTVDIAETTRRGVARARREYPHAHVTLDAPDSATVTATLGISEAVDELVTNAIVHNDRESPVVRVSVDPTETGVQVSVADDGPGIPEMDRTVLEEGRALDDLSHGSGLGLWLVYWLCKHSGGSIEVNDVSPRGSAVVMTLPNADDPD